MTDEEQKLLATVAWKENRRGAVAGMTSIMNVVMNRAAKHGKTIEEIIMAPWQFTSMSVASDPEYAVDPVQSHGSDLLAWITAQDLALKASESTLEDSTGGSTLYFAPLGMKASEVAPYTLPDGTETVFPKRWNANAVRYSCTICQQLFFVEI